MAATLIDELRAFARAAVEAGNPEGMTADEADVLADRSDGTVLGYGAVVAKAHPPPRPGRGAPARRDDRAGGEHSDGDVELTVRLGIAAHPCLTGILLPPIGAARGVPQPRRLPGGRLATLWPRGTPVSPDAPDAVPWEAAGVLLARLHAVRPGDLAGDLPAPVPAMRGPAKAARAMRRLRSARGAGEGAATGTASPGSLAPELAAAADAVETAWALLPPWCRDEAPPPASRAGSLCHGDFHLGQLISHPRCGGSWLLIDVDDLGLGDPAWDLARPAAWYASGLLDPADWERFLGAYRHTAGEHCRDPWPLLDAPARTLTAQTAALGIVKAHAAGRPLDEAESACVEACVRMAHVDTTSTTRTISTGGRETNT
ncbi:aminoglycoside phosphotransferase [Streptomyces daqingensis]|uniref:Aminoglycoside phosphotransferase n=2 Tax=Streptomyces daqingensis TaxID=1472640 RepID=A0ABQ2LT44_9ACTN|nr:aminoglycoside phosphotransferase [Streptomyces daqingensis]